VIEITSANTKYDDPDKEDRKKKRTELYETM
jgi:hypothetical protein